MSGVCYLCWSSLPQLCVACWVVIALLNMPDVGAVRAAEEIHFRRGEQVLKVDDGLSVAVRALSASRHLNHLTGRAKVRSDPLW
jgi:hypothetical protein